MFKELLKQLMNDDRLTHEQSYAAMKIILEGQATPSQVSSFITILTFRGVETEELTGLTQAMRDHALPIELNLDGGPLVDTCGTGGDGSKTFNVSTASALVASSSGLKIAKHGNRSVSSLSGSADVLEELGLNIEVSPEGVREQLNQFHMCFMFAPMYHQSMKHVAATRKEIGFRTVFNLLGPMTNPAGAKHQVIGVFDQQYSMKMAEALKSLGAEHVLIVQGEDGLDEFSVSAVTHVTELKDGHIQQYDVTPEDVGLKRHALEDIQVETAHESALIIENVLSESDHGAARDIVCFNAGAALYVGGKANTLSEGVRLAQNLIDTRQAYEHYLNMSKLKGAHENA